MKDFIIIDTEGKDELTEIAIIGSERRVGRSFAATHHSIYKKVGLALLTSYRSSPYACCTKIIWYHL